MASGLLFAVRAGAFNLLGAHWPRLLSVRVLSWIVDTTLLAAATTLMILVRQYPFVDHWLTVKVTLLVIYIGLGTQAFAAARRSVRIIFWMASLSVFVLIISVARAHHPLGPFA